MMQLSRKEFLGWLSTSAAGVMLPANEIEQRAAQIIQEYDQQGVHRTATKADEHSARWLATHAKRCGGTVTLETFAHNRIDPQACFVAANGKRIAGLPIFDAPFTAANGLRGKLGAFGSNADIGWIELPPNAEYGANYEATRRNSKHKAILVLTKGARPGLCPINAPEILHPYGPPMLQISSEHSEWVQQQTDIQFVAHVKRTKTTAINVTATIKGTNNKLAPLVVMTPRSGWGHSTSERGGGIVCWLEVMRALAHQSPARDVHFLSSSGHELGHLGLQNFIARHPTLVPTAHAWIHFGANIGAVNATNRIQASSDELESIAVNALSAIGVTINDRAKRGTVPLGEAGNIHHGGGQYLSLLCPGSPLFHHPADRWPDAVDVPAVAKYATAFVQVAQKLAQG
ncbi:MAG TPA: M28 family peptidase [Blastocatellia bacterium]|nr:M28 family peptidase [Blastocatellia bacterium]